MKQTHYDLVILGSGSTAFVAALRAHELGKTSVMTQERTSGGTCVNRGCPRSKNLIEAARLVYNARNPRNMDRLVLQGRENNCLAAPESGPSADPLRHFRSPAGARLTLATLHWRFE